MAAALQKKTKKNQAEVNNASDVMTESVEEWEIKKRHD